MSEIIFGFQYIKTEVTSSSAICPEFDNGEQCFFYNLINRLSVLSLPVMLVANTERVENSSPCVYSVGDITVRMTGHIDQHTNMMSSFEIFTDEYHLCIDNHIISDDVYCCYYIVVTAPSQKDLDILLTAITISI